MKQSIDPENYEKNKGQGSIFLPVKGNWIDFKEGLVEFGSVRGKNQVWKGGRECRRDWQELGEKWVA